MKYALLLLLLMSSCPAARAAIVVAAADSAPEEKSRADLICDGTDDQVELAASLARAATGSVAIDIDPGSQATVTCRKNHSVRWLPGTYNLSETLEISDAANCVIDAEGSHLTYLPEAGDAVVIRGMNACRYRFGTIECNSTDTALCIRPNQKMPSLMSFVDFMALIGHNQQGTGLLLDPSNENVCVNRFQGTDIAGFDTGVCVGGVGGREGSASTLGKCDTNWFWLSYVRFCKTCIEEGAQGVDCSNWQVNVDASLPNSVAIRAGGGYGKWYVIMGTFGYEQKNPALILTPGARHCVFEMHPPIEDFAWEDNSGVDNNLILSTNQTGFRRFSQIKQEK